MNKELIKELKQDVKEMRVEGMANAPAIFRLEFKIKELECENFLRDTEKMLDFKLLSKEAFLKSYSYITEEEYNNTLELQGATQ